MSEILDISSIESDWFRALESEFSKDYFIKLKENLKSESLNSEIYPPKNLIFNAFNLTPFDEVKVVILGQDPYHGKNQAMGLSFSVPDGIKIPPSLKNIYKEIYSKDELVKVSSGDLNKWAKQGVLLLNATLSVSANRANSHKNFGWQNFSDAVIKALNNKKDGVIFMLWGNFAKEKVKFINPSKHFILTAPHPSPLARGFSGCDHFNKANEILKSLGKGEINWRVHI